MHVIVTITRKQVRINWADERRLYARTEQGVARAERCIARLQAQGYTEQAPQPDAFTQLVTMVQADRASN